MITAEAMMKLTRSWDTWTWPNWVPEKIREQIESFWDEQYRGPIEWVKSNERKYPALELGATMQLHNLGRFSDNLSRPGRFVYAWNNMARLVHDDGTFSYVSMHSCCPHHDEPLGRLESVNAVDDHICSCGLPMVRNPHPQAGKIASVVEVGVEWECIPCLVLNRHRWAERAMRAEGELDAIKNPATPGRL